MSMDLSPQNQEIKQLLKETLIEVLTERQDLFIDFFREVMEDSGLGKAIKEGKKNEPVSREEVFKVFTSLD